MSDRNTHDETFENIRDEESLAGLIRQAGASLPASSAIPVRAIGRNAGCAAKCLTLYIRLF